MRFSYLINANSRLKVILKDNPKDFQVINLKWTCAAEILLFINTVRALKTKTEVKITTNTIPIGQPDLKIVTLCRSGPKGWSQITFTMYTCIWFWSYLHWFSSKRIHQCKQERMAVLYGFQFNCWIKKADKSVMV